MDVFPGAYVAKLAITAAVMIGAVVITALSSRLKSILRNTDGVATSTLPYTTWVGVLTFFFETGLVVSRHRRQDDPDAVALSAAVDIAWSAAAWIFWLADAICVTRITWDCGWSPSACANIGVLCAFIWVEWSLLSSRLIVIAAEHAKIRLSHMMQALQKKLAPWFRAAKEPVVQIAASVGVLLSGVVGSVGLLITGLVGIVDRMLDIVGLGGMRRRLMRVLGLDRILGGLGVDKVLAGLGLGDLLGETAPPPDQGKKTAGGSIKRGFPIVGDLGLWNDTREAPAGERRTGGEPSGGLPVVGDLGLGRTTATTAAPEDDSKLRKRGGQGGGGGTSGLPLVGGVLEGGSGLPLVGGVLGGGGSPTPRM